MNEIIITIIILGIIIAVILAGRKQRLTQADSNKTTKLAESESWAKESVMSYNQVQQIRKNLIASVEEKFTDSKADEAQLKEIINDWADLKIRSFQERRSWVRRPDKTKHKQSG